MKIGASVRAARKAKKWTLERLAHEVGTDTGNLSRLERDLQSVNSELMDRIIKVLGISVSVQAPGISNFDDGPEIRGLVPLVSWVQAGCWNEVSDLYAVGDAEEMLPCPISHGPRTFAVRIRGESMYNPHERRSFREGDIVFVDPDVVPKNRSFVVAKLVDSQEATFKQLIVEGNDQYLKALNPMWPDPILKVTEDAVFCGVAIAKHEPLI
ncbi:helix-turn-helix domain-containing protein [Pseudomonas aeruginosa]|nr:helix-turn-helix domain-containing protein [Pseudomonas aeruginosa]MBG4718208.1 helix-turn-helix domain-containing protein [Pseudomonas aeruginosa]HEJ3062528.1 helix-turn-helix domain-containing protein [Pseudomonas aeruginosa]